MTVTVDLSGVNSLFKSLKEFSDRDSLKILRVISYDISNSIANRVQDKGQNADRKRLKNKKGHIYSNSYRKHRLKKGYKANKRTLTSTGKMFESLTVVEKGQQNNITFLSQIEKNKASWNDLNSPFFSIGKDEDIAINNGIERLLKTL